MRAPTSPYFAPLAALVLALAVPVRAPADEGVLTLGLRFGGSVPLGNTLENASTGQAAAFADELRFALPFLAEVGWRLHEHATLGIYGAYGRAALSTRAPLGQSGCSGAGAGCSGATSARLGLQVLVHAASSERWQPWAGVGSGYEWLGYDARDASGTGSVGYRGWEWLNLQAGVDVAAGPRFAIGPWSSLSVGEFTTAHLASGGQSLDVDIRSKAVHLWLQLGVRVRFEP
jgi:hypothetical protein